MLLFYCESFCNDSVFYYLSKIIIHNITPSADYDATTRIINARKIYWPGERDGMRVQHILDFRSPVTSNENSTSQSEASERTGV